MVVVPDGGIVASAAGRSADVSTGGASSSSHGFSSQQRNGINVGALPTTAFYGNDVAKPKCEPKPRAAIAIPSFAVGSLTAVANNLPYFVGGSEIHRYAQTSDLDNAEAALIRRINSEPLYQGLRPTRRPSNTIRRSRSVHVGMPGSSLSAAGHYGLGVDAETPCRPSSQDIRFVSAGFCL